MKYRRWNPPPIMRENPEQSFFRPEIHECLPVRRNEKVFAIGSCFARNVEAFLTPYFQVPSYVPVSMVPPDIAAVHSALTANLKIWHRYNIFSIRNSLTWALTQNHPTTKWRPLRLSDENSVDPYAGFSTILKHHDTVMVRNWVDATIAEVRTCRLVILTLGLSEVWLDCESGLVMNCAPLLEMWQAFPNRFSFHVASCRETLEELNHVYEILSRYCPADFQIVVTVSPVPLLATFRKMDVVVANSASKAILRAAVDQWADEHENVHYFPSYEMVLNSNPKGTWLEDFRHCTSDTIAQVVQTFLTQFVSLQE
jgi:hypothetical protein